MKKQDVLDFATTILKLGADFALNRISQKEVEEIILKKVNNFTKQNSLFWRIFG